RAVGPDRGARQFELAGTLLGVEHARVAAAVLVDLDLAFALERGDVGARGRALRAFTGGGAGGVGAGDAARRGRGRRRARGGDHALLVAAPGRRRLREVGDPVGVLPLVHLGGGLLRERRGEGKRQGG